ncbi:MAG: hypothetical protein QW299_07255 [Candidatus Caldarchaeum sp.]
MPELKPLDSLKPEDFEQTFQEISQRFAEAYPFLEGRRGAIRDLVLKLAAILGEALRTSVRSTLNSAQSLLLASQTASSGEAVDDLILEMLLANFRLQKQEASQASGPVLLLFDRLAPVVIPSTLEFSAGSVVLRPRATFSLRTFAEHVVSDTDRLLTPYGSGLYAATIDCEAVASGISGNLRSGTNLAVRGVVPHLVQAMVQRDFSGGLSEDTLQDLVQKVRLGLSGRHASSRASLEALLRLESGLPISAVSVIGYDDAEQQRYHSLFPVAFGGRTDVYVRTAQFPHRASFPVTATYLGTASGFTRWRATITPTLARQYGVEGYYGIEKVVASPANLTDRGYDLLVLTPGFYVPYENYYPDVTSGAEASFSAFQTVAFEFLDTDRSPSGLIQDTTIAEYTVQVLFLPGIGQIQTLLTRPEFRPYGSDIVVRAAVPCFVTVRFAVLTAEQTVNEEAMRSAIAEFVNSSGFTGHLTAHEITAVAARFLKPGQKIFDTELVGKIIAPPAFQVSPIFLRSSDRLSIPHRPEILVTPRTTVFFLDPGNISITRVDV